MSAVIGVGDGIVVETSLERNTGTVDEIGIGRTYTQAVFRDETGVAGRTIGVAVAGEAV